MQQETTGISAALSAVVKAEHRLNAFLDEASFPLSAEAREDRAFLFQILHDARAYTCNSWQPKRPSRRPRGSTTKLNQNTACDACDNRVFCKRFFDAVHTCVDNGGLEDLNLDLGLGFDDGGVKHGFVQKGNDFNMANHANDEMETDLGDKDLEVGGEPLVQLDCDFAFDEPALQPIQLESANKTNNMLQQQQPELELQMDLVDDDDEAGSYNHETNQDHQVPMTGLSVLTAAVSSTELQVGGNADSESDALIHDAARSALEEVNRVIERKSRVVSVDRGDGNDGAAELKEPVQEAVVEVVIHQERVALTLKQLQRRSECGGEKSSLEQTASLPLLVGEPRMKKRGMKQGGGEEHHASASDTLPTAIGVAEPKTSSRRTRGDNIQTQKEVIVLAQKD
ncbi:UNVERIFIED_CONTAM: hypothetical protein HDU68_005217, partial [Siphonaria sp. JEL0065]